MKLSLIIVVISGLVLCQGKALTMRDPPYAAPSDRIYQSDQQESRVDNYRNSLRAKIADAIMSKIKEITDGISDLLYQLEELLYDNGLTLASQMVSDIKYIFDKFAKNVNNFNTNTRDGPTSLFGAQRRKCPPYDLNCEIMKG